MKLSESFKALIGMKHRDRYLVPASEARSISLYGSKKDREIYIMNLLEEYSIRIKEAAKLGKFSIIEELRNSDYSGVLQEIMEHFRSVGYGVRVVDNKDLPELYDDKFLIIAWKDIIDVEKEKTTE